MSSRRRFEPVVLAGLIVVWAAAWSAPFGQIVPDTKYDLVLDPWGFLGRALSLWDAQQNWGGLANQAHGYLFPMGPFFGVLGEIFPAWVVQRLWWTALLTLGFIGAYGLLRVVGIGSRNLRVLGALAWVLAPKVVSSFAVLSGEVHPHLLMPMILWPVIAGWRGRIGPWQASLLSGGAIVLAGGVNGAAVLLAIAPTGIFLITRRGWWRSRLTWTWAVVTFLATAWWLGPLLFMAWYSSPFLDWIENSAAVSAQVGLLDVFRGTTQWLGHLLTTGGPWWPGGYQLATSPWLIILTSLITALGLCGLALRSAPLRGFLWTMLIIGLVAISLPHDGALSSPLMGAAQSALDGPLAAFRNIHKADGLVRLPLVVGLVHILGVVCAASSTHRLALPRPLRGPALGLVGLVLLASAAPAFTGQAVARGGHEEIPGYWTDVGEWLDENNTDAASLVVPAANFGEYLWGRPLDEPLRALTSTDVIVRDAIPLVNAGSIRLLDEVERRLQSGRGIGGMTQVLRDAGVRYLIVRNDVATEESGQPPVAVARGAVRATEGITFVKGFGGTIVDVGGVPIHPVEVYELTGRISPLVTLWPASAVISSTGASDDLVRFAEAGLGGRPVVFSADDDDAITSGSSVLTDGLRARETFFGAPRGADSSTTLTSERAREARDYRPPGGLDRLTSITYGGIRDVTASSSIADELTFAGLNPAMRPFAALDQQSASGWLTMWDPQPTISVELNEALDVDHIVVTPWTAERAWGPTPAVATAVQIITDSGTTTASIAPEPTRIALPAGETTHLDIRIIETTAGPPDTQLTGLADISIPGVSPVERVTLPRLGSQADISAILLSGGRAGTDGCFSTDRGMRCLSQSTVLPESVGGATYLIEESTAGTWTIGGTLVGAADVDAVAGSPDVSVSATSARNPAPAARPESVIDGDRRTTWSPAFDDPTPELVLDYGRPVVVSEIGLRTSDGWSRRNNALVRVRVGGQEFVRSIPPTGRVSIPPTRGDRLTMEFVASERSTILASMELAEVVVNGQAFTPPDAEWTGGCGLGPDVAINGETVPTRIAVTREGWLGLEEIRWEACEPVVLTGQLDEVRVNPWNGLAPGRTELRTEQRPASVPGPSVVPVTHDGRVLSGGIQASDQDRLLVLTQNASDGWHAEINGTELVSQVVDGRRQGFVVPADVAGRLSVQFEPERFYRPIILVGLASALTVLLLAAWHGATLERRGPSADSRAPEPRVEGGPRLGLAIPVASAIAGLLIAGPVGGLAVALGWVISRRAGARSRLGVAGGLVAVSATAQAVVAPASVGPPWLEGTVRLLLLIALGVAAAGGAARDEPGDGQLDELVAEER